MSLNKFLGLFILSKHRFAVWKEEEVETSGEVMALEFQTETCCDVSIHWSTYNTINNPFEKWD